MQDGRPYTEASQATTVLVLGILGIVLCGILGPVAWVMGNQELAAIDAGRRPPENRGTANAGRILGIITTVLLAIGLVAIIAILVIVVVAGTSADAEFQKIGDQFNSLAAAAVA